MDVPETKLFGNMLRAFRLQRGLTQEALAHEIGNSSRGNIDAWETGKSRPRDRETVLKLARALRLSESEIDSLLLTANHPQEYHTQQSQVSAIRAKEPLSLVDLDISEHNMMPILDITLLNSDTQTARPVRVLVDILDVGEFYDCDNNEDDEDNPALTFLKVSGIYDVKLSPASKGKQISVKIAHLINTDETDRFQIKIGPGFGSAHLAYAWYYLKITVLCSEAEHNLTLDPVLLSIPQVEVDTEDIANIWMDINTTCTEQNRKTLHRMKKLSARRSASVDETILQVSGE